MGLIYILGSAYAVPAETHENTHLFIKQGDRSILIDTASNPINHLRRAGIDLDEISDLILTHFHPDHVSGAPLLLMDMWLLKRTRPLNIHGLAYTIDRFEKVMELYNWETWPGFYPVQFFRTPEKELSLVLEGAEIKIFASPVRHLIPTLGLRAEFLPSNKSMAYSCDTEPCEEVVRLGKDVDVMIHEASGASKGHTSAEQAAEIALRAGARRLYLIHYPTDEKSHPALIEGARRIFGDEVLLAEDFMKIELD
jgi:ribonuclease Z